MTREVIDSALSELAAHVSRVASKQSVSTSEYLALYKMFVGFAGEATHCFIFQENASEEDARPILESLAQHIHSMLEGRK